jgi:hypothetical protein
VRTISIGGVTCALLLLMSTASADVIANIGTNGGGTWQAFPIGGLNEQALPNQPYWDSMSADGSHENIGYYLTTGAGYPNSPNLTNPQWLGVGNFAANNIIFQSTGPETLTLLLHVTGNADIFGVFNAADPTQMTPLFTTATAQGTSIVFTSPYSTYGFYLHYLPSANPAIPTDTYTSITGDSVGTEATSLSPSVHQHFAVFAGTGGTNSQNFIIGAEDGWGTNTNITINNVTTNEKLGDFQDFVVAANVINTSIPEPASVGFILAGLGGLLALRSRKAVI